MELGYEAGWEEEVIEGCDHVVGYGFTNDYDWSDGSAYLLKDKHIEKLVEEVGLVEAKKHYILEEFPYCPKCGVRVMIWPTQARVDKAERLRSRSPRRGYPVRGYKRGVYALTDVKGEIFIMVGWAGDFDWLRFNLG